VIPPDIDDAWIAHDPVPCPICGCESCEDHLPDDPSSSGASRSDHNPSRLGSLVDAERLRREARRIVDAEERPPLVIPPFDTLRTRLARPVSTVLWRVAGWLPVKGRALLAAQWKAGKTTCRDNFLRSLVDGDPFLGRAEVTPITGTAVVLDCEMSGHTLDHWLRDQRIANDDRIIPISLRGQVSSFNPLDPAVRAQWVERLRRVGAEHLILDCLRPVLDALGLDEQHDAGRFLVAFDALLTEAAIPEALVVHHMGHGAERSRGDSRLRDWPDVEWRLMRRDEDAASPRFITAYGRDVDVHECRLVYDRETRRLTLGDGSRRDERVGVALAAAVNVLIGQAEGLSGRAVAEALEDSEHSRDTVYAALRLGVKNGTLTKASGPKNAHLYRVCVRVSGSVREPYPDTV
jgi:hypothetical protein